jgi:pilus assembly protein CpaB
MRALGLLLVAISAVLVFVALHFVRTQNAAAPNAAALSGPQIVVAAAPLTFGDHIRAADLRLVRWPSESVPNGAFSKIDDLVGKGEDRVALGPIEPGEPVLASRVTGNGGRASLSSIIAPGMRAVTLRVNDATGVAGFILPNDRVDVLLTRTPAGDSNNTGNRKEQPQTEILLQNVKVLGVDQEVQDKKDKQTPAIIAKVVTVEVTPQDAEKLTLGQQIGTLSLALRNYTSKQVVDVGPFSGANLQPTFAPVIPIEAKPAPAPKPVVAPPPQPVVDKHPLPVTILRGAAASTVAEAAK